MANLPTHPKSRNSAQYSFWRSSFLVIAHCVAATLWLAFSFEAFSLDTSIIDNSSSNITNASATKEPSSVQKASATRLIKNRSLLVRKIKLEDGIVGTRATSITQDQDGFIWIASDRALHRYDGHSITPYTVNKANPNSLPFSGLLEIYTDSKNQLWIASIEGLARLDLNTQKFTLHEEFEVYRSPKFFEDYKGRVWYINGNYPRVYDPTNETLQEITLHDLFSKQGFAGTAITMHVNFDPRKILILRQDESCMFYNIESEKLEGNVPTKLQHLCKNATYINNLDGRLLVHTTDSKLHIYNIANDTLLPILEIQESALVTSSAYDKNKNLWIGTNNALYKQDTSGSIFKYASEALDEHTLNDSDIGDIFVDNNGATWIAGQSGGSINIHSKETQRFLFNDAHFDESVRFTGASIEIVHEGHNGDIWVASKNKLAYIEKSTGITHELFAQDKTSFEEGIGSVSDIAENKEGQIFFGTTKGVYSTKPSKKPQTLEKLFPQNAETLPEEIQVLALETDENGDLWIGTSGQDLIRLNPSTKKFHKYNSSTEDSTALQYSIVLEVFIDSKSRVWAPTVLGLSRLDTLNSDIFTNYQFDSKRPGSLCGRVVHHITEDHKGTIWLATNGGLARYEEDANQFTCFGNESEQNISAANTIYNDQKHNALWVGSNNGLSKFSYDGAVLDYYNKKNSVLGKNNTRSGIIDADGILWLGTKSGLYRLKTSDFTSKLEQSTNIKLSEILVNGNTITQNKALNQLEFLNLAHNQNNITIAFSNLHYVNPEAHQYKIKLEGWDNDWSTTGNTNFVTYRNLAPGSYTFKVARSDDEIGNHLSTQKQLQIKITPPWWLSTTAYIIYGIVFLLGIYFAIKLRTHQLELKALKLEGIIKENVKSIENLLKQKDTLYANISHEFRTPLTLIIGPAETIHQETESQKTKAQSSSIIANAKRILRMIDYLLDVSRMESGIEVRREIIDCSKNIDVILSSFRSICESHNISIQSQLDTRCLIRIEKDGFEKIIVNLLSNAFKYSPKGSEITILCVRIRNEVHISVADNGPGIRKEDREKIFQRFIRLENANAVSTGAGIGLALVKQIVTTNGGRISVGTAREGGAKFDVFLPSIADDSEVLLENPNQQDANLNISRELDALQSNTQLTFAEEKAIATKSGTKLLVVEDDHNMRSYLKNILQGNYEVEVAEDGEAGLSKAKEMVPDLIITDLMMPKMSGFELAKHIRGTTLTSHIPLILLTARVDSEAKKEAWITEIDDFFEKPFSADELLLRIENLLSIRSLISKRVSEHVKQEDISQADFIAPKDKGFINDLNLLILKEYSNPSLSAKNIASALAVSESQLQRKMKALLGQTVPEYVRNYRLAEGKKRLLEGHSVTEVAYMVGFSSHTYFSNCFKALHGVSPRDYVKNRLKQDESHN